MKLPIHLRARSGFTVVELMVSMVMLAAVLGASTITLLRVQRGYVTQRNTTEARESVRSLELLLARVLRTARVNPKGIPPANMNMVVSPLAPTAPPPWSSVDIRADFNPLDSALTGEWEDVRVELSKDTVYVRPKKGGAKQPVAYPVSELRLQFYALDGTELTTTAAAGGARSVKVTIAVPVPKSSTVLRRESWVYLRN